MKNCNSSHYWQTVGYYNAGWGISSDCEVLWCKVCGAIHKNKTVRPEISKKAKTYNAGNK